MADQAVSSLGNVFLTLAVARAVTPGQLGAFSLAYASFFLGLGCMRGLCLEPLLVSIDEQDDSSPGRAAGAVLFLAILYGSAMLMVAGLTHGALHQSFLVLALCTPGLFLQDAWRFVLFALRRPSAVAANDGLWLVLQLAGFVVLHLLRAESIESLSAVWGGTAALCGVLGAVQARRMPNTSSRLSWIMANRSLGLPFAAEFLVYSGSGQLALLVVATFAGLANLGAFRAAMALFGPLQVMVVGLNISVLAEGTRVLQRSTRSFRNLLIGYSVGAAVSGIILGVALAALPASIGTALTGATWPLLHRLVVGMTIFTSLWIATAAPAAGLRILRATRTTLGARSLTCVLLLVFAVMGASGWGIQGAIAGFAASQAVGLGLWWREFGRALRKATPGLPAGAGC